VALVCLGWYGRGARLTVTLGVVSSVLTVLGYFLSPEGGIDWVVLVNRLLAFVAIWVTAAFLIVAKRAEEGLREANDTLEKRVQDRTAKLEREVASHERTEEELAHKFAELELANIAIENQGVNLVKLAEDLSLARDLADSANQAKSNFLSTMSHELRTPLNAILGFSEIMNAELLGPLGDPKYHQYACHIHESGAHLLSLINDILDLSKIESGNAELHETDVAVPVVTEIALRLVRQRADQDGVVVELEQTGDLPALHADERKVVQILVNLLTNAIKFTEMGGTVTLKIWCRADSGYVFQVLDTGIGIAREDIPKALSQFGQIESSVSRKHVGTGLGLPLTKSLVELHGGSLDLQSEIGNGTTVTVRFPAERIVDLQTTKAPRSAA
jgi:signal transduction histidine kinase